MKWQQAPPLEKKNHMAKCQTFVHRVFSCAICHRYIEINRGIIYKVIEYSTVCISEACESNEISNIATIERSTRIISQITFNGQLKSSLFLQIFFPIVGEKKVSKKVSKKVTQSGGVCDFVKKYYPMRNTPMERIMQQCVCRSHWVTEIFVTPFFLFFFCIFIR